MIPIIKNMIILYNICNAATCIRIGDLSQMSNKKTFRNETMHI